MPPLQFSWLFLIYLLILSSCGGSGGSSSDQQREEASGELIYDSELSAGEKRALDSSVEMMKEMDLNGAQIKWFSQIFGGNSPANVVTFFGQRVNYALSASTDIEDRIVVSAQAGNLALNEAGYVAFNQGISLWYYAKANEPDTIQFQINDELLKISSSRIGVIQLGDFIERNKILQVEALVHEARHSDCTGGALASDIERIQNGLPPLNHPCGHLHVECPPQHQYAGLPACDAHHWGAYAIGAIYAAAIALECNSCTETQKILAESIAIDSQSRLLYDVNILLDGGYGPPDMSSSNQVRKK